LSDQEDLELEALQRKLDDAFETTRPRRGFEDELWLRMQRKRPFGSRMADAWGGLVAGFREAPGIPIAATALVLVVAVGVGVLSSGLSPFAPRHEATSANAPGTADYNGGGKYASGQRVPSPALHPGLVAPAPASSAGGTFSSRAPDDAYYGPAELSWSGSFPTGSVAAPVLIYGEPSDAQRQADARIAGLQGVTFTTRGSVPELPLEPSFIVSETEAGVAPGTDPVQAAGAFLAAHNLLPPWPTNVTVIPSGAVTRVVFERAFPVPGGDDAYLVNWNGDRYGIEVDIAGGRRIAVGPLQLSLQSVSYPLVSNDQAAQMAVSEPPATTQSIQPVPAVKLDRVELVYALAFASGTGFYEPAYLFSGTFQYNGRTYVKRVLVPLVDPSLRS
jgi:hypothetical protein